MSVVGIIVKPCNWKGTTAARFEQLPEDGRAVSDCSSADHALADVTRGIRAVVMAIHKELAEVHPRVRRRARTVLPVQSSSGPSGSYE